MISKQGISSGSGAAGYFEAAFSEEKSQKADNYYVSEQAPAVWKGRGSEILGIKDQQVKREDFVNLLNGKIENKRTGELQDLAAKSTKERRAGVDFTVSPPKSVSIVGLAGNDQRVVVAHEKANEIAMSWLEKHASTIRISGPEGKEKVQTGNLIYATVRHETNRSNEPQLHNHNVIIYASQDENSGKWRSLTNDELFSLRKDADTVYKVELANELKKLGYEIEHAKNGVDFEIKGISRDQIEAFATRSTAIAESLEAKGLSKDSASWEQRSAATLGTRGQKVELSRSELQQVWSETSAELKMDLNGMVAAATQRAGQFVDASQEKSMAAVVSAVESLSEREQSFTKKEIEIEALKFGAGNISSVEKALDILESRKDIVENGRDKDTGLKTYTTHAAKNEEQQFLKEVLQSKNAGNVVIADAETFKKGVEEFERQNSERLGVEFKLSQEQVQASKNILMHPDAIQAVQGDAGTGKTAALEAVNAVAKQQGWQVIGLATVSTAAEELERSSGIKSQTVASFLNQRENKIADLKKEINNLQARLNAQEGGYSKVDFESLGLSSGGIKFEGGRYFYNRDTGDVLKSPDTFRNAIGNKLMDFAAQRKGYTTNDETLIGRLKSLGNETLVKASDVAYKKIATYERVGVVEGIEGKSKLIVRNSETKLLETALNQKKAALENLMKTGNADGSRMLIVMDESSMTGMKDTLKITNIANSLGARLVFQGDIKQHSSVPAGRAFFLAQEAGVNVSKIEETRRFNDATEKVKNAIFAMKTNNFSHAVGMLDSSVAKGTLQSTVAEKYVSSIKQLEDMNKPATVGVVTLTNKDRKAINAEIHSTLLSSKLITGDEYRKTHLDDPKLTKVEASKVNILQAANVDKLIMRQGIPDLGIKKGDVLDIKSFDVSANKIVVSVGGKDVIISPEKHRYSPAIRETRVYSVGDKVEARNVVNATYNDKGKEKSVRIKNGSTGRIIEINDGKTVIQWGNGKTTALDNKQMAYVDLGYARTTYKEQGATNQIELFAVSSTGAKIVNKEATYVALTRSKFNTEIIVDSDKTMAALIKNAGNETAKSTALTQSERQVISSELKANIANAWKAAEAGALGQKAAQKITKVQEQQRQLSM